MKRSMAMKSSITLIPYGGLANRMKAMEALIALIQDTNVRATAIWFKDKGLNCSFERLFQPLDIPQLTFRNAILTDYLLNHRPRKNNFYIPYLFETIRFSSCLHEDEVTQRTYQNFDFRQWVLSNRKTYLSACLQFYPGDKQNSFSSFIPIPELQERINERSRDFTPHTIGIHIRRTDNIISIEKSPTELFILRMKEEVKIHDDVSFYLASDSPEEKKKLIAIFGNRIITDYTPVSRSTPEGVQDALVELYTLSRTQKIIGSYYSSYSETAADIGNIPHEKIKRKT
ncbi:glycosyl transferase [uncultured Proteiniphilum sp.]|uniref:glycosyl transferase n=1 Tax=uncultured Proteiniphilum sp. TaxID=497637 RepID=UPI002613C0B9|nr:glycosyl transferase [uncultured Proteiniphilum sp.]